MPGMDIICHADPAYQQFSKTGMNVPYDIRITLTKDPMPDTRGAKKVFDSGESWSLFSSGEEYFLFFKPPIFDKPYLIARMNQDISKAVIYCSRHLISEKEGSPVFINPFHYPLDQILFMHYLASRAGILVHAAGIEINGKGYIFAGRSGAGKTTISRQFVSRSFGTMLSDDRVIIRKIDDTFKVFGTPWPGEGGFAVNRGVPLGGIFFIAHRNTNMIEEIIPLTTIEKLLPVASIPWYDHEPMSNILSFCDDLIAHVPSYILHFSLDTGVVDMLEKFISQNEP